MNKPILTLLCIASAIFFIQTAHAVEQGDIIPDCKLNSLSDAKTTSLKQFQGKVLYIDFWASWCGPCAKSFPFLNTLHDGLNGDDFQIIGINLDENTTDAQDFLAKYPASFSVVSDVQEQCAKQFAVQAMPSSYLVDRNGIIRHVHLGFRADEAGELKGLVEKLLAGH